MDVVRFAISRPVTVAVGVILVVMFGLIGFGAIPIQLAPNVDQPEISVTTSWPGRSPEEVVDEITKEQEEVLKNLDGLKKMTSTSTEGQSVITLEFVLGTNIDRALQETSDSLRQVPEYPDDVDEPVMKAADGASENAIAWIIVDVDPAAKHKHPGFDITTLFDPLDQRVKPYLERVDGVAEINIFGGREREMRVLVDYDRLALLNLNHLDVLAALQSENRNVSAGTIAEGKRDYRVRVIGQYESESDILDTIVAYRDSGPVYVRDVADVELGYQKRRGFVRSLGYEAIAINAIRQNEANVMEVMEELRTKLEEVRTEILPTLHPTVGPDLRLRQVYDETIYITSAIDLVTTNLWLGGGIAAIVLLIFLRSFVATGVIALAIPISVIGTFLMLLALGRTLNVISLAGLAFAVGMVVDNAIVVLENIDRHRRMGKPAMTAAYEGGREVWGAILASTLTTVAVFVPILTVQEEAGQLFRDISLAIVCAVALSLITSITVIPAATSRWFGEFDPNRKRSGFTRAITSLFGIVPLCGAIGRGFATLLEKLMTGFAARTLRPLIIVALALASVFGAWALMPPVDYLPAGNRNLVFGGLLIPPGYSVEQMEQVAGRIEDLLKPYMHVDPDDEQAVAQLPPIENPQTGDTYPPTAIDNMFVGAFGGNMFGGATSAEPQIVVPIGTLLTTAMNTSPDVFGFAAQSSLFGRGVGGGNTIDVEIAGPDLSKVTAAAGALYGSLGSAQRYGFRAIRPEPSNFNLTQPETRVRLSELGTELGLRTTDVGTAVRALFDGAFAGDFRTEGESIDIRLVPVGGRLAFKEQLIDVPIATPRGPIVPLDSVVEWKEGTAPQSIVRVEELPAVIIRVQKPEGEALEATINDIRANHVQPLQQAGLIDGSMQVRLEGTAAKLDEVQTALLGATTDSDDRPVIAAIAAGPMTFGLLGVFTIVAIVAGLRAWKREGIGTGVYAAAALVGLGIILAALTFLLGNNPQLITARFIWALAVTYLLMCALFESFVYPFVIMFAVPLAVIGGFAGLRIVHDVTEADPLVPTQNLDVLTMLGFVILVGVVVNNAILIVHQSLNLMRGEADTKASHHEPMATVPAIAEAVRTRIRPIFMSTLTSVGGMLPLVIIPGAGSELYRGLGSVVVGGLLVSTVFTLLLVPLTLSLVMDMTRGARIAFARAEATTNTSTGERRPTQTLPPKPARPEPVPAGA
jgi:hydrophobic/amphiphilic exporter-1 (mainly G- bacteria), HAE1 family